MRNAELLHTRKKHDQVKHLALCISDWTRRLKTDELDQLHQQQLQISELLHERKCHKVHGMRDLSSDTNGNKKHHNQVKHLVLLICDWTKRLEPHRHVGSYIHAYVSACIMSCCCTAASDCLLRHLATNLSLRFPVLTGTFHFSHVRLLSFSYYLVPTPYCLCATSPALTACSTSLLCMSPPDGSF